MRERSPGGSLYIPYKRFGPDAPMEVVSNAGRVAGASISKIGAMSFSYDQAEGNLVDQI
jgi:hypothetical protein